MSSEIEQLVVKISADARALEKAMKDAKDTVDDFGKNTANTLKKVGAAFSSVGKSLTKYVTAPLSAFAAVGVQAFTSFETNLTKATAIMDVTTEDIAAMKAEAIRMGNTTVTSSQAAAEGYFFLASAGLSAKESVQALSIVNNAAIAGNFDLATATDLITDAQSALGLMVGDTATKMENMIMVSDVLVRANTMANATVEQFATSLTTKAGAALKNVGKSIQEGTAVLAVYADQGVKAQLAGNNLSRTLLLLQQTALKNAKAYDAANVKVFDGTGKMRHMADIVKDLEVHTAGMSDELKAAKLAQLGFTAEVQAAVLPLLGTSEQIKQYEKNLKEATGFTEDVAGKQQETFGAQMKMLWNQIRNVAMEIGNKLVPMIKTLANWVKGLIEWWNGLNETVKTVIFWTGAFLAALGPILIAIGSLLGMIAAAILGYVAFTLVLKSGIIAQMASAAAQWLLNAAIAAAPFAIFAVGVAAVWKLSSAIYNANADVQKLNQEMEKSGNLQSRLMEITRKGYEETNKEIESLKNPEDKFKRLSKELELAKRNAKGTSDSVARLGKTAEESAPTMLSLYQAGKAVHQTNLNMLKETEERLEMQRDRVQELQDQYNQAKQDLEEYNAIAERTGMDADQFLLIREQHEALEKMNEELEEQAATVGMTAGEIEIWRAKQAGANEETIKELELMEEKNAGFRQQIEQYNEAKKAAEDLAAAEKDRLKANEDTVDEMQKEIETFGMSSRQRRIYEMETRGATKAQLEFAKAQDAYLTEQEKKDKLMKKGEQLTKSLRTEEEKLKDGEEELKKMLQEGAIDLETYSRGMEKLHEKSKKEFKVKFKVSGVDAVIAGSADAAARLEEFRALQKKGGGEEKVDFKKQGRDIQLAHRAGQAVTGGQTQVEKDLDKARANVAAERIIGTGSGSGPKLRDLAGPDAGNFGRWKPKEASGSAAAPELSSMDNYLEQIKDSPEKLSEQNLLVVEPAGLA